MAATDTPGAGTHGATTAAIEQPAHGAAHDGPNPVRIDAPMVALTWITFGLMAAVLYKVAWKPVLAALQKREDDIRRALDEAQKTREEYARIDQKRQQVIGEADAKARELVEGARKAATEAAAVIENKAREEAQILVANAQREIRAAQDKAVAELRRESAELAVNVARKILRGNLDEERSRALASQLIKDV